MTLRTSVLRLRSLAQKSRLEKELEDEIRAHLELAERDARAAGMSAEEARRAVRRSFGGIEQMKDVHRDQRSALWLENLVRDIRYGLAALRRNPGYAAVTVGVLALGIGANVAMFSVFHQALMRPLPYAEPENLVLGRTTFNGHINPDMSAYDFFDYRDRNQVFESVGSIRTSLINATITGGDRPEQVGTLLVSWDLFPTLGVSPVAGRHFFPAEGKLGGSDVVLISGSYWKQRFGGAPDVVGSTIVVDGKSQTIVGVMPPEFRFLHDADVWMPMRRDGPSADSRGWHNWLMVGRLKPGISIEEARSDLDMISARLAVEYPETNRVKEVLLTELRDFFIEDSQTSFVLLMAAVSLVLLIACGNVASLLLARGVTRRSELCVRSALGASPSRLAGQLLTESMVTAVTGGILGTSLAVWFQKLLLRVVPAGIPGMDTLEVSWPMLAFALAVSVTAGLLFGILPAVQATNVNIAGNIGSGMRTTDRGGQRILSGLIVAQVAVTVILLIGSGLLLKSFATLRAVEPGFDSQSLLTTELRLASDKYPDNAGRIEFFSSIVDEIRAIPGVSDVAVISRLPIQNPGNNPYAYAAEKPQPDPRDRRGAYWRTVMPGYFGAMGIPLRRGRGIEMSDTAESPRVLVINETMARTLFPNEDPLGKLVRIHQHSEDYEVVGVVGDVRLVGTRFTPRMAMYASYLQQPTLTMRIAVRTAVEPTSLAEAVRKVVWDHDRDVPVIDLSSMDEFISNAISNDGVVALSVSLFATVSVLLSALGLYGVLTYYVNRRTREIGLRIFLGADTSDVVRPVLRRGLSLVATGFALGVLGSFWATRLIQRLLFNVQPTDAATYVFVFAFVAFVGLVACSIPALRAVKVDPVSALLAQ